MADGDTEAPSLLQRGLSLIQNPQGVQGPGLVEKFLGSPVGKVAQVPLDIYGLAHALKGGSTPERYFAQNPVAELAGHEAGLQNRLLTDPEFAGYYARAKLLGPQLTFLSGLGLAGPGGGGAGGVGRPGVPAPSTPGVTEALGERGPGPHLDYPSGAPTAAPGAAPEGGDVSSRIRGALGPGVGFNYGGITVPATPPTPLRLNPDTAKSMGVNTGDNFAGRSVLVEQPKTPAAIVTKEKTAETLNTSLNDLDSALGQLDKQYQGGYGPRTAALMAWKKQHPVLSGGVSNEWTTLLNWADLNSTALMNMHVGARGSEGMMQHFINDIVAAGAQGSSQLHTTIGVLRRYLNNVRGGMDGDQALSSAGYRMDPNNPSPTLGSATVTPSASTTTTGAPTQAVPGAPVPGAPQADPLQAMRDRIRARSTARSLTR